MTTASTPHAPGTFCWLELCAADAGVATRFYEALFGWTTDPRPIPGGTYVMCALDGRDAAAIYQMSEADRAKAIPAHWFPYVAVASADDSAAKAAALGAAIDAGPFDVMEHGRMAVIRDPAGAYVGLWQAKRHVGVQVRDEPGALCWTEAMTRDRARTASFYGALLDYEVGTMPMPVGEYTIFSKDGAPRAGALDITPEMGDVPSGWLCYFAVADCDATAARVRELGGAVLQGPADAPGVGRWALVGDPQGAVFGVIALAAG